jgi:ribonuclease III
MAIERSSTIKYTKVGYYKLIAGYSLNNNYFRFIIECVKFLRNILRKKSEKVFHAQLQNLLGFEPGHLELYKTALSHRSVREGSDENNERLEFLGDAILSSIVAHYLFMKYPYKDEGYLTEMRSKMVNRNKLNDIALKIGLKKVTLYNKHDNSLKTSQIFGNTLEAVIGAVYLDKGYAKTKKWVTGHIIYHHLDMEEIENLEINLKNKLYGWANKNGKVLEFETLHERMEGGRKLFTIGAMVDGEMMGQAKAFNKKDASEAAAQKAIEKLGL